MSLKSLEQILQGVGKLRAASVVAWAANSAAFLGLHLSPGVQHSGLLGGTILIAAVNVVDGYIRGQHVAALPALISQGAESVSSQSTDPRVDAVAQSVQTISARIDGLENRPTAPSLAEIIAGLTGKDAAVAPMAPSTTTPVVPSPVQSQTSAPVNPLAPVPSS